MFVKVSVLLLGAPAKYLLIIKIDHRVYHLRAGLVIGSRDYCMILGYICMRQYSSILEYQSTPKLALFLYSTIHFEEGDKFDPYTHYPLCLFADLLFLCNAPFGAAKLSTIQQRLGPIPPAVASKH